MEMVEEMVKLQVEESGHETMEFILLRNRKYKSRRLQPVDFKRADFSTLKVRSHRKVFREGKGIPNVLQFTTNSPF